MEPRIHSSRAAVHELYTRERDVHKSDFARLSGLDRTYSNRRLLVFALLLATGALAVSALEEAPIYTILPLAVASVFIRLLIRHDRVLNDLDRAKRLVDYYEAGLARLEDRWAGKGESGARYRDHHHPYSEDLDLFGAASLYELLCNARTRMGQDQLAEWLRAPADPDTVVLRQEAVAELATMWNSRRSLATQGGGLHSKISAATLINWGEAPVRLRGGLHLRIAAGVLSTATISAGIAALLGSSAVPFYALFVASQALAATKFRLVAAATVGIDECAKDLARVSELIAQFEEVSFRSQLLKRIRSEVATDGMRASHRIRRLKVIQEYLDSGRNLAVAPFAALILWTFHLAYALERWRDDNGPMIAGWLDALASIEALSSLATYAFENPQDGWPTIEDRLVVEAVGLGHPLLPLERMVRNDVGFSSETRLLIVSGSNMSGKSTLLRALGVNVVLAFAGGPVRAERLVISRVNLGASIRTLDSLQEGVSRFYAEISRLRQILEIARKSPPCLFLLDEILHGTNSHDRRIGAEAIARALIDAGAIGLLTTHDLAISQIADEEKCARNVHFEDHLADGKMAFDYTLREGVVRKSNAIELMRSVGLPV